LGPEVIVIVQFLESYKVVVAADGAIRVRKRRQSSFALNICKDIKIAIHLNK